MRRLALVIVAVGAFAPVGCEDGPQQTYQAPPNHADRIWNDGATPGVVGTSSQSFAPRIGGRTAQALCTGEERQQRWADMMRQPLCPPTTAAGLNAVGGPSTQPGGPCPDPNLTTWTGLTIEEAERGYVDQSNVFHPGNCQSNSLGDFFGDGTLTNAWGDNNEVTVKYIVSTHRIQWISVNTGYEGELHFHSRPVPGQKVSNYTIKLGEVIQKDGANMLLDWNSKDFNIQATEIADALFATFAPSFPAETAGTDSCIRSGRCTKTVFSNQAVLRIWSLGMHLWINQPSAPQPTPSKFGRIDFRLPRILPGTFATTQLKLDALGPVARSSIPNQDDCVITLDMSYGDFLDKCINTSNSAADNATNLAKFTGDMEHDTERFIFDSAGIALSFKSKNLAATDVLRDQSRPAEGDVAASFYVDASSLGKLANDIGPDGLLDLHGSGLVYLEYARLVQSQINQALRAQNPAAPTHELGDPACLFPDHRPANFDPSQFTYAPNCTGFEGFVTAAPIAGPGQSRPAGQSSNTNLNRIRLGSRAATVLGSLGLKPGSPSVAFCMDATGDIDNDYQFCGNSDSYGLSGAMWDTSFQRVLQVLGHGDVDSLPAQVRDRRFFWQQYVTALMKYLKVASLTDSQGAPDIAAQEAQIGNVIIDPNFLFFDADGSGQYERGEFIDRGTDPTKPPVDLEVTADILNGTFFSYRFQRTMYRPESALYAALRTNPSEALGQQITATLTNLFGSPVLKGLPYHDRLVGSSTVTAFHCASADWHTQTEFTQVAHDCGCVGDPNVCTHNGQLPPLDPTYTAPTNGPDAPVVIPLREGAVPIYAYYPSGFGSAISPFMPNSSKITILSTTPDLQTAQVSIVRHQDPYDAHTPLLDPITVLVPWQPQQPGVGFLLPISGTRDKLVETENLNFAGVTITANIDYLRNPDGTVQILAIETTDFLGDVFLCQDPDTGDILKTKMYGSVQSIVEWMVAHPNATDACGLIVRYSPFNNFPDFIFSTSNGVRVNTTSGGGYGRVIDATLYVPSNYGSSN